MLSVKKASSLVGDSIKIGGGTVVGQVIAGPIGGAVGSIAGAQMCEDDFTKKLVTALGVLALSGVAGGFIGNIIGGGEE